MTTARAESKATSPWRRRLAIVGVALLALLILGGLAALLTARAVFIVARIEGQSMAPTLRDQDRLLVYRLAYHGTPPNRGDIVMMRYPPEPSRLFTSRVIALPGERIHIQAGRVHLDGHPYDDSYVPPEFRDAGDWGPEAVPEGQYFVMGDRRNDSSDSRQWGFVPAGYIMGRVTFRWWPDARQF